MPEANNFPNGEGCPCADFEPEDDDPFNTECICGHVIDEHKTGFLASCTIGWDEEEEGDKDAQGN